MFSLSIRTAFQRRCRAETISERLRPRLQTIRRVVVEAGRCPDNTVSTQCSARRCALCFACGQSSEEQAHRQTQARHPFDRNDIQYRIAAEKRSIVFPIESDLARRVTGQWINWRSAPPGALIGLVV